ncbi:MAG: GNAT family N-acetyltransferase [Brasilonema angustatum HA4187-MV1]|jgi:GNAT superfamily N-acetyltransferase|nr:GNAT family N-acetyltransferase [Brasilonema angustatum HA4187-MV1]
MTSDREARWTFVPIEKKHQRDSFDCGYPILNDYLKKYARQNHNKGVAKTFVAIPASESLKIDGYYTVSASVIEYESLPESYQRGMPAYPIPAILIGRLAVDHPVKGQGLGGELLTDALYRGVRASQEIGVYAVRVDAIDFQAREFYLKYEFIPFQDQELSLFLPMATIIGEFS